MVIILDSVMNLWLVLDNACHIELKQKREKKTFLSLVY